MPRPRLKTHERGYGHSHQKTRARLLPAAMNTPCPIQSPVCDGIMVDPRRMHLDHSTPRALGGGTGDRIVCMPCNCSMGARLKNRLHKLRKQGLVVDYSPELGLGTTSRDW